MMGMGMGGPGLTGIWLLHFGIIAILDAKMFKVVEKDGKRQIGALVWGIVMLSLAGIAAIEGLWGLFHSFMGFGYIEYNPFPVIAGLFANLAQLGTATFVILSGVKRVRMQPPGFGIPKIIFGANAMFFGLLLFIAIMSQGYYYF
ncbi:MAG: hypothetical protein M0R80_26945 [Proteobacteria bacterium]|jgi:hypothetical protein|nr:hypothetical protein [Pseudomonadota bacterium]